MRLALPILGMLLLGCSAEPTPPTAPTPAPALPMAPAPNPAPVPGTGGAVWLMVAESTTGICILGAKVDVIAGQAAGQTAAQDHPCNIWDIGGVEFDNLIPGTELTVRASAPGYATREMTVVPTETKKGLRAIVIELSRNQAP